MAHGVDERDVAGFSDVPLPAKKRPNPNIIFAIDDSGSMDGEISLNGNDGALWYNRQDGRLGRDFNNKDQALDDSTNPNSAPAPMDKRVPDGLGPFDGTFNFNRTGNAGTGPNKDPNFGNVTPNWKKYVYLLADAERAATRVPMTTRATITSRFRRRPNTGG